MPVVGVAGREWRWGDSGYRDALCERICATLNAAWEDDDSIVLDLSDDARLEIPLRADQTSAPEAAVLTDEEGQTWVWQV